MIQFIAQKGLLQESVAKVRFRNHKIHYSPLPEATEVPGEVLQI